MMNIKNSIKYITEQLEEQKKVVRDWEGLLEFAETSIENHVYESLEKAENFLMSMFENKAFDDCEGAGNVGDEEYEQDFIVAGKEYTAIGKFEYNRHDKTYWYIDSSEYEYKEKA